VELKSLPPKLRGEVCDALFRERYPTIRWSFEWEGFVITGVPDGITGELVYEYKTTLNTFLTRFIEPCALVQADLYGLFFRRNVKRVQICAVEKGEVFTWQRSVEPDKVREVLTKFKRLAEGGEASPPKPWKCSTCEFKERCTVKNTS